MKIQANITISRDSNNVLCVRVEDEASRSVFLEMGFELADFMQALTGLGHIDAKTAVVNNLSVVGKRKISEPRSVVYPGNGHDRKEEMVAWLKNNCKEDGWEIDSYLGSQSSITRRERETILNFRVYRYEALDADQPS